MDCLSKFDFSWKYKNYELRATPKALTRFNENELNETIDFVYWIDEKHCISLAYFVRNSEGYDLKFVDNRPFKYIEENDLFICWYALKMAHEMLSSFAYLSDYE